MRFLINVLLIGLIACNAKNDEKIILLDSTQYTILEGGKIYGHLTTSPNNGYVITRTSVENLTSFSEQVNATVSLIGMYSTIGDQLCLRNEMVANIRFFNRWGQEVSPSNEDLQRVSSRYQTPESFNVQVNDKTLIKG